MISGANEEQLEIANDRADLLLEIDRLNNIISELENKIYYLYNYAGLDTSNLKNELQELKEKE